MYAAIIHMVDLLLRRIRCRSNVADSVELEVEKGGQLKIGHYVNSAWFCNVCFKKPEGFGTSSSADVSPNTPRANDAGIM
jgi:hypothetical protein